MSEYAKAIVALIGVGVTTLLALIPPDTTLWIVLTVTAAVATAAGVYLTPNTPAYQPAQPDEPNRLPY